MLRRDFLRLGTSLALLTTGAPLLDGCSPVARDDLPRETAPGALAERLPAALREALYLASLAPSGHNTQPWRVFIDSPRKWVLGSAPERRLPAVDPDNRELLLSLGAFLENLDQAVGRHGFRLGIRPLTQDRSAERLFGLELMRDTPRRMETSGLEQRMTLRTPFRPRELERADLDVLTGDLEGVHYLPAGSPAARYLDEGTVEANRTQAWREPAQAELADWIRWSDAEAGRHRNGLTPAGMGITGMSGWFVSRFFDRETVLDGKFRRQTVDRVADQLAGSGGWLVLEDDAVTPMELALTGRRFERLFLRVRERGIGLHPMSQMLEEAPWRDEAQRHLGLSQRPQFLLRVGYVDSYPPPASLRMPPSRFVLAG